MRTIPTREDSFARALAEVQAARIRPEFEVEEGPAPHRLAPSSVALTLERTDPDATPTSGRFVLLHDPDGVDEWAGCFRVVVFVRATLESELSEELMLHEVGWSWLQEAIDDAGAHATALGGTVTRTTGRSFGTLGDRPADCQIEIRASWTPLEDEASGEPVDDLARHVVAWVGLTAHAAGLPPLPEGVTHVGAARRRHRR